MPGSQCILEVIEIGRHVTWPKCAFEEVVYDFSQALGFEIGISEIGEYDHEGLVPAALKRVHKVEHISARQWTFEQNDIRPELDDELSSFFRLRD